MATAIGNPAAYNTRRAPRYRASLPVLISRCDGSGVPVPGLTSEISQTGMAVFGGVTLETGDLMEVEFQTEGRFRVEGIVRNRSGFCFGLEFLNVLPVRPADPPQQKEEVIAEPPTNPTLEGVVRVAEHEMYDVPRAWLTAHRGDFAIALAAILLLAVLFGAANRSTPIPGAQDQPHLTSFERMLIHLGMAVPPPAPIRVTGNPNAQVWVDVHTALYYCSGADLYGKTPGGRFASQHDARLDHFDPAGGNTCQ